MKSPREKKGGKRASIAYVVGTFTDICFFACGECNTGGSWGCSTCCAALPTGHKKSPDNIANGSTSVAVFYFEDWFRCFCSCPDRSLRAKHWQTEYELIRAFP